MTNKPLLDARTLHKALQVKTLYPSWIKSKLKNLPSRLHPEEKLSVMPFTNTSLKDYWLSLLVAKSIAGGANALSVLEELCSPPYTEASSNQYDEQDLLNDLEQLEEKSEAQEKRIKELEGKLRSNPTPTPTPTPTLVIPKGEVTVKGGSLSALDSHFTLHEISTLLMQEDSNEDDYEHLFPLRERDLSSAAYENSITLKVSHTESVLLFHVAALMNQHPELNWDGVPVQTENYTEAFRLNQKEP